MTLTPSTAWSTLNAREMDVLVAVVGEPGEWTQAALVDDIGCDRKVILRAVASLRSSGLLVDKGHDVCAMQCRTPAVDVSRVSADTAARFWALLVAVRRPMMLREAAQMWGIDMSRASKVASAWRNAGAVSSRGSLWPTSMGRAVVAVQLGRADLPPIVPRRS